MHREFIEREMIGYLKLYGAIDIIIKQEKMEKIIKVKAISCKSGNMMPAANNIVHNLLSTGEGTASLVLMLHHKPPELARLHVKPILREMHEGHLHVEGGLRLPNLELPVEEVEHPVMVTPIVAAILSHVAVLALHLICLLFVLFALCTLLLLLLLRSESERRRMRDPFFLKKNLFCFVFVRENEGVKEEANI